MTEHTTAVGERIAEIEAQWSWERIDPAIRTRFAGRVTELLGTEPETEWKAMPLRYRREIAWHLSRTPEQHTAAWEEECHRLRLEADEATVTCFRNLIALQGGSDA